MARLAGLTHGVSLERLVEELPFYYRVFRAIVKSPFSFPRRMTPEDKIDLRSALGFLTTSFVLIFFFLVPWHLVHGDPLYKWAFFLEMLVGSVLMISVAYVVLRLGSPRQASYRETFILFCYQYGFWNPIVTLLSVPMIAVLGPSMFFELDQSMAPMLQHPYVMIWHSLSFLAWAIFAWSMGIVWYSHLFGLRRLSTFFRFLLAGFVGSQIYIHMVNPLFRGFASEIESFFGVLL